MQSAYIYTLLANMCFALGSQFFTHYSRKFSSLWMNTFKALVAASCFLLTIITIGEFHPITTMNFFVFFISGFIALGIGDIFLLKAFSSIGPGRTMVIFGFHPLIVGILSFFVFSQVVETYKLWGIVFFILCLLTFSYEGFKSAGRWKVDGLSYALIGMSLDAIGVIITRMAFDMNESLSAFEGNLYRCIGALTAYWVMSYFSPFQFRSNWKSLNLKSRAMVFLGAFLGTYLSLAFYLTAIQKTTQLASITAISITSVLFSATFESIWERKLPSKYFFFALIFFAFGMKFILF